MERGIIRSDPRLSAFIHGFFSPSLCLSPNPTKLNPFGV